MEPELEPEQEPEPEPEPAPDDAAVAAALGHAAQTFPLCNYFKSKAKLDRPAPSTVNAS